MSPLRTAQSVGLKRLYRYEEFNPQHFADVLTERRVHLSDPRTVNDPWDCRPWFSEKTIDDIAEFEFELFVDFLFSAKGAKWTSPSERDAFKASYRCDLNARRSLFRQFCENFQAYIPERWKILCLTSVPDSTLMWSHYADHHRGVCLEFSPNGVLGAAMQVEYRESYPLWSPHTSSQSGLNEILLTKSADWSYEHEYRLIGFGGQARPDWPNNPLQLDGDFLPLPSGALESVIVGCEAPVSAVSRIAREFDPGLTIKRMVRAPNRYKLEMEEVVL
jgi:hypothetical protein